MSLVKITKVGASKKPEFPTPKFKNYKQGEYNGNVSLPKDYCVIGNLINPIIVGKTIQMWREMRNGEKIAGYFSTSIVKKITKKQTGLLIETNNSKYLVNEV